MAFGIPNSEAGNGGEFLGRIQYDARSGFWKVVKRVQGPDGSYTSEEGRPQNAVTLAIDFGSLEVGYSKIASQPVFMVAPYGKPVPAQPEEMGEPDPKTGRVTKAFKPAFRVKVGGKVFGDGEAYYFSSNAKNVLGAVDVLHELYRICPEAAAGKIPLVKSESSSTIKSGGSKFGVSTNYAPDFEIAGWIDRPAVFGDRTVPAPVGVTARQAGPAASAARPANHAPPPPAREPAMAGDGPDDPFGDSDLPF